MGLELIRGTMGAGKTYIMVHNVVADFLTRTNRTIYTNLPIKVEPFVQFLSRSPAKQAEYRRRIVFLEESWEPVMNQETGEPMAYADMPENFRKKDLGKSMNAEGGVMACRLRHFWNFTTPNAVIVLDELGEIYNARDYASNPQMLGFYVNQHRHYKDDLYFIAQDEKDIDAQVRRKIRRIWMVRDMSNENMFPGWSITEGMKWPWKMFRIEIFLTESGLEKEWETTRPEEEFTVRPSPKGFGCYDSFSKSSKLPGKLSADEGDVSGDVGESLWVRWKGWRRTLLKFASMGVFLGFLIWGAWRMVNEASMALQIKPHKKKALAKDDGGKENEPEKHVKIGEGVPRSKLKRSLPADGVGGASVSAPLPLAPVERFVFSTPSAFATDQALYRVGDLFRGAIVERIGLDGFRTDDGREHRFTVVFSGRGRAYVGDSGGPGEAFRRKPPVIKRGGEPKSDGDLHRRDDPAGAGGAKLSGK